MEKIATSTSGSVRFHEAFNAHLPTRFQIKTNTFVLRYLEHLEKFDERLDWISLIRRGVCSRHPPAVCIFSHHVLQHLDVVQQAIALPSLKLSAMINCFPNLQLVGPLSALGIRVHEAIKCI